jgi:hypothetical protein
MSRNVRATTESESAQKKSRKSQANGTASAQQQASDPAQLVQRAATVPRQLAPSDVLQLQRTVGNRAVNSLLSGPSAPQRSASTPDLRVSMQAKPTIQRVVQTKFLPLTSGGFKIKYYSTHDTATEFDSQEEAWKHDQELAGTSEEEFDPFARYPTNYSYYNTSERNVMPTSKQGPHTLSHSALSYRLDRMLRAKGGVKKAWQRQVLRKDKFGKYLHGEMPAKMRAGQRERMLTDYGLLHDRLENLLTGGEDYSTDKHELMMRLMQLDPYSAYGKGRAGRRALKGKGERRDVGFDSAFDRGAKFRNAKRYEKFRQRRKELFEEQNQH